MSDKNFKIKSGLQVPGVTSANFITTDSSGVITAGTTLPVANGGTGQTTADNALNALLPLQTGNDNKYLQTNGVSTQWSKVFYQSIKDNGTTVTPRGYLNIVGGTFSDDSLNDITTIDLSGYVSQSGGSTITSSSASVKGLTVKGAASQTANLFEIQDSSGNTQVSLLPTLSSRNTLKFTDSSSFGINWGNSTVLYTDVSPSTLIASPWSASRIGFIVKGLASQTANLQEWQNSSGTVLASIGSGGASSFTARASISQLNVTNDTNYDGLTLIRVTNSQPSAKMIFLKAAASQTADFISFDNSAGTVLAKVQSNGVIDTSQYLNMSTSGNAGIAVGGSYRIRMTDGNTRIQSSSGIITTLTVEAAASQAANLQEWKNSSNTVLASISSSGNLMVQDLTVNGTTTTINSTTLTVDDKNIELASVTSPTDTTADGAGITIKGATDKTFNWVQSTAAFTSSEPISAPAFKSAGTTVSSDITLSSGYRYFVDTTSARTLTLPASPSLGDEIQIYDASNNALTNNITIASNSNKIQGSVQDLIIDSNAATVYLTYTGSTYGWAVN